MSSNVSSNFGSTTGETVPDLSERQILVLRAIVASYVGEAFTPADAFTLAAAFGLPGAFGLS